MSKLKLFAVSFLLTVAVLLALIYAGRPKHPRARAPQLVRLSDSVFLTSQLRPESIRAVRLRGIDTIVDLRPDGESEDQPSSSQIKAACEEWSLRFYYIPTPHEGIPDTNVDALRAALSENSPPVLLYCRTGRRAARVFALAEASRTDGPGTDEILAIVRTAGFSADDLRDAIAQRILQRSNAQPAQN